MKNYKHMVNITKSWWSLRQWVIVPRRRMMKTIS